MPNNINKVIFGDNTLMDLTSDTVEASNLLEGETAHDRSGTPITGTAKQGHVVKDVDGNTLTQRPTLRIKGGIKATDDSTNQETVLDDSPEFIDWDDWREMTDEEKAEIPEAVIENAPLVDGELDATIFKKLWENPNPTSAFAAQPITLASDDYDFLMVSVIVNSVTVGISVVVPKGKGGYISQTMPQTSNGAKTFRRLFERISDTEYSISECMYEIGAGAWQQDNSAIIPYTIYGFKKSINFEFSAIASDVSTSADKCVYDNTDSGLEATNVQDALDELDGKVEELRGGYKKIASSSSSGAYRDKMAELKTTFDALSIEKKLSAKLKLNGVLCTCVDDAGIFTRFGMSSNDTSGLYFRVNGLCYSSSGATVTDISSTSNSNVFELWVLDN